MAAGHLYSRQFWTLVLAALFLVTPACDEPNEATTETTPEQTSSTIDAAEVVSMSDQVRSVEPQLAATVDRLWDTHDPTSTNSCFHPSGEDANIPPIGVVDEICVFIGRTRYLTMTSGPSFRGLLYNDAPGQPRVMSKCLKHLYGPWWEVSDFVAAECPAGFEAIGA